MDVIGKGAMEVTLNRFLIGTGKLALGARYKGSIEIDILAKILFPHRRRRTTQLHAMLVEYLYERSARFFSDRLGNRTGTEVGRPWSRMYDDHLCVRLS